VQKLTRAGSNVLGAPVLDVQTNLGSGFVAATAIQPTIISPTNPYYVPGTSQGALINFTYSMTTLLGLLLFTLI